jgi:hypothetical protein
MGLIVDRRFTPAELHGGAGGAGFDGLYQRLADTAEARVG